MRLEPTTAREWLAAARVARLATSNNAGTPHIVPVTFAASDDVLVTAVDAKPKSTRALKRLHNIEMNPRVCLLTDSYTEDWTKLWWARADGVASIINVGDRPDLVDALRAKYPQYREPPDGPLIIIAVSRWTGWQASELPESHV